MNVKGCLDMMKQVMKSPYVWGLSVALGLMLAYGCGPLDNKGTPGENKLPEVFIVNIPPDGSEFSVSPTVYWYGTDGDGQILRYDYTVVVASEVDSVAATLPGTASAVEKYIAYVLNDQFPRWISIFVDSTDAGEVPTQESVRLFASKFPSECDTAYIVIRDPGGNPIDTLAQPIDCVSDTIPQYFFVRALDDQGEVSQIKYRTYKRRNHWPTTIIPQAFNQATEYVSLKSPTTSYSGIRLLWNGSDRLDFIPPAEPFLEFHWRLYGPFPVNPSAPTERPTLADTLGRQPVVESANPDPLLGVWVRDTLTHVYDLWRQVDSRQDPLNDTTITRTGWFMLVVTARDDAFVSDETPAIATFKAIDPKFERKIVLVDDTWYGLDSYSNPASSPDISAPNTNQAFHWNMVKMVYPEADTMLDFWWRSAVVPPGRNCPTSGPPSQRRVRCGNYLSLELLLRHKLCVFYEDDIVDNTPPPGAAPAIQSVLSSYLEAGGMIWFMGRHSLISDGLTCQVCKERLYDFCEFGGDGFNRLGCDQFDVEGMYYPAWRGNLVPITKYPEPPRQPATNDEFIGGVLAAPETGLPQRLEVDPERLRSMYMIPFLNSVLDSIGSEIVGIPDVGFMVLGETAVSLYSYISWRPGGPIPPYGGQSFQHGKPVAMRRVGPSRENPNYKVSFFTFPLYFIKQEQSEELYRKMIDWFFLPFSQS